jgi:hypothetical protein
MTACFSTARETGVGDLNICPAFNGSIYMDRPSLFLPINISSSSSSSSSSLFQTKDTSFVHIINQVFVAAKVILSFNLNASFRYLKILSGTVGLSRLVAFRNLICVIDTGILSISILCHYLSYYYYGSRSQNFKTVGLILQSPAGQDSETLICPILTDYLANNQALKELTS